MRHILFAALIALTGAVVLIGTGMSQDTKKPKGFLPDGWKSLGLSDVQKEKIYGIQSAYKEKIEKTLTELRAKQSAEMIAVLTEEQKDKLRRTLLGETGTKDAEPKKDSPPK